MSDEQLEEIGNSPERVMDDDPNNDDAVLCDPDENKEPENETDLEASVATAAEDPSVVQRPTECTVCSATFERPANLIRHMKMKHSGDAKRGANGRTKRTRCTHCEKTFARRWHMLRHLQQKHGIAGSRRKRASNNASEGEPATAEDKPSGEESVDLKGVRVKRTSFQCTECDSAFSQRCHMLRHLRQIHGRSPERKRADNPSASLKLEDNTSKDVEQEDNNVESDAKPSDVSPRKGNRTKTKSARAKVAKVASTPLLCSNCACHLPQKSTPPPPPPRRRRLVSKTVPGKQIFPCSQCEMTFPRKVHADRHRRLVHLGAHAGTFTCDLCSNIFSYKSSLRLHMRKAHDIQELRAKKLKCSIVDCVVLSRNLKELVEHLNTFHEQNVAFETLGFVDDAAFKEWLIKVQNDVPCSFQKRLARNKYVYYYCSRTGSYKPTIGERKRRLKVQGSSKIGRTCPAHIVLKRCDDGSLTAKYISRHYCHTDPHEQLGHLRLSGEDRKYIADQIANKVPLNVILEDVRRGVKENGKLRRIHLITKRDLRNVQHEFKLTSEECRHRDKDKEFIRLIGICKGRYAKRPSQAKRGHQASLSMTVQAQQLSESEWAVPSESTDEPYVVRWENDRCARGGNKCRVVCKKCNICAHMFTCTCSEGANSSSICKHVHFICWQFQVGGGGEPSEAEHVRVGNPDEVESEVAALVRQMAQPAAELKLSRQRAKELVARAAALIDSARSQDQLTYVEESLRIMMSNAEALGMERGEIQPVDEKEAPVRKKIRITAASLQGVGASAQTSDVEVIGRQVTGHEVTGHDLTGRQLTGHNITGHNLTGPQIIGSQVTGHNLTGSQVTGLQVTGTQVTGLQLTGPHLQQHLHLPVGSQSFTPLRSYANLQRSPAFVTVTEPQGYVVDDSWATGAGTVQAQSFLDLTQPTRRIVLVAQSRAGGAPLR